LLELWVQQRGWRRAVRPVRCFLGGGPAVRSVAARAARRRAAAAGAGGQRGVSATGSALRTARGPTAVVR